MTAGETALDGWLRKQAARERRVVVLEEGLLGDRLWRYSAYRLRYFFLSYLNESALHAVSVLFLFRHLAWGNFRLVIVATTATAFVAAFWWGALEALRGQVRDLHRSGKPHRIERAIAGWLTLALLLSAVVLVAAVGWTVWRASDGSFGVADAFVASLFLRLALDLPVRSYHSGVYAIRRVYKPLAATLAPEFLGLAAILALWPLVGVWSVVAGSLLGLCFSVVVETFVAHPREPAARAKGERQLANAGTLALGLRRGLAPQSSRTERRDT